MMLKSDNSLTCRGFNASYELYGGQSDLAFVLICLSAVIGLLTTYYNLSPSDCNFEPVALG